jgi:hypothetical protein
MTQGNKPPNCLLLPSYEVKTKAIWQLMVFGAAMMVVAA